MIVFLIVGILALVIGIITKIAGADEGPWYAIVGGGIVILIVAIVMIFNSFVVIDGGEIGVKVRFGKVLEEMCSEGFNKKSIFEDVSKYSIRIKEYTMSASTKEGTVKGDDSVSARTKDNSEVTIDGSLWWAIDKNSAYQIYKKLSKTDNGLVDLIIRPAYRSAIRDVAAEYTLDSIMLNRAEYSEKVFESVAEMIGDKGLIADRILIRNIQPPIQVDEAIQKKLQYEQELKQKEFQLETAKKDAEIRREEAKGIADAQKIIQKDLTPIYVQFEAIQAYRELAESQNTTFVIMPTSTEGAGMPLIIGNN